MEKTHELFKSFDLYSEVVQQNYMRHKELIAITKERLSQKGIQDGATLIDLGCGNAHFSKEAYPAEICLHYKGIDLSENAIYSAKNMLHDRSNWDVALVCDDMLHFLENSQEKVQFISSGFCLHHLSTPQKKAVFSALKKRLLAGGTFFSI